MSPASVMHRRRVPRGQSGTRKQMTRINAVYEYGRERRDGALLPGPLPAPNLASSDLAAALQEDQSHGRGTQ